MSRLAEGEGLIETMQVLRKTWADFIGQSWTESGATMGKRLAFNAAIPPEELCTRFPSKT